MHTIYESLDCLEVFTVKSLYCLKWTHKYFNPANNLGIILWFDYCSLLYVKA